MRYMIMFKTEKDFEGIPACKDLAQMGVFMQELKEKGVLLATEGLHPSERGARVRLAGGKLNVTDGPFAEAKELVAGFALVEVPTKEDAVQLAGQFLGVAGEGTSEVREVIV
ncbi:MAG TPA: YciI family protein [Longimicrobium sp.]|jgi:hypothetical protein